MKRLLRYLKNYKIQCVLAPLFKMLEALFELFVPLVIAALIDRISDYSASGDAGFVLRCFVLLIILGVVGLISSWGFVKMGQAFHKIIRDYLSLYFHKPKQMQV